MNIEKLLGTTLLLGATLFLQSAYAQIKEIDDEYPPPFVDDFNVEITKTLSKNDVRGCGVLKYRASKNVRHKEYLVYCSTDGENWKAYFVYTLTGRIIGPMQAEPSLR